MPLKRPSSVPTTLEDAQRQLDLAWEVIEELKKQVEELSERLGKNSRNSSKAPSSDSDLQKKRRRERRQRRSSGRPKGAQPGHEKHERTFLPELCVDKVHRYFPPTHCSCGGEIQIDRKPTCRHQVFDLPIVQSWVDEHQIYAGRCPHCQRQSFARLPDFVPCGQMGPGLMAWIVMMSGQFHLSTRKIQRLLQEQWQLNFSIGAISEAQGKANAWLDSHYQAIAQQVRTSEVAHADETSHWSEGERAWMWVLATPQAVLFLAHLSRGKKAAGQLLSWFRGFLVTDQFVGYDNYDTFKRQLCWAHLIRKFTAMSERPGNGGRIGKRLLLYGQIILRIRHQFEQQRISEPIYLKRIYRIAWKFEEAVERGSRLRIDSRTANQCKYLLPQLHMCWTFLQNHRIALTNNAAERALRPYVIWRKLSFGTQSTAGNQFRSMILSVVQTLQLQKVPVYKFLRQSCDQYMRTGQVTTRIPFGEKLPLKAA